jgi:hypothetical protein
MSTRDTMTESGANLLAADIRAYWLREHGLDVSKSVWAEQGAWSAAAREAIFVVRSDFVNGMPRQPAAASSRALPFIQPERIAA